MLTVKRSVFLNLMFTFKKPQRLRRRLLSLPQHRLMKPLPPSKGQPLLKPAQQLKAMKPAHHLQAVKPLLLLEALRKKAVLQFSQRLSWQAVQALSSVVAMTTRPQPQDLMDRVVRAMLLSLVAVLMVCRQVNIL